MKKKFYAWTVHLFFLLLSGIMFSQGNLPDNKGREFWIAFPGNHDSFNNTIKLFITGNIPTTGSVEAAGLGVSETFDVMPDSITTITLPASTDIETVDVVENKGVHITANDEITVYGLNQIPFTTDAFLALPVDVLSDSTGGSEYINLGYTSNGHGSQFAVVSAVDNNQVTITPSSATGNHPAGTSYTITLQEGETYQLRTFTFGEDLSGTIISATGPLAAFGGHQCATIPIGFQACDHIVEQLPPTGAWGRQFVTVPLATRLNGDTFRLLASDNNTVVTINGTVAATLNRGEFYESIITTASEITADKPILVAQYSNGTGFDGVTSDPFMMLIPPFEQFQDKYTFSTPSSGFPIHYVNLVVPANSANVIQIDNTMIPASDFSPIGSSGFSGAQVEVTAGAHTVQGDGTFTFGLFIYGFGHADSYGYTGGSSFSQVAQVDTITFNTPFTNGDTVAVTPGDSIYVDCVINAPISGVRVDFQVRGANTVDAFFFTDSTGLATATYQPVNYGVDTCIIAVSIFSDTLIVNISDQDLIPPDLFVGVLGSSVARHFLAVYTGSNEELTGAVNGNFTFIPQSGNSSTTTEIFTLLPNHSDVYHTQYQLTQNGQLNIDVTGDDLAGNTGSNSKQYNVAVLSRGTPFTITAGDIVNEKPRIHLQGNANAVASEGYILIDANQPEALPPSIQKAPGLQTTRKQNEWQLIGEPFTIIGTADIENSLALELRYKWEDIHDVQQHPDFDERKIGIYRQTGENWQYVGGEGKQYQVKSNISTLGKYALLYNDEHEVHPTTIVLLLNYPNPFNPQTTIQFNIAKETHAKLTIFNTMGQEIRTLLNSSITAGIHEIVWDAKDNSGQKVASGVYIYRLQSNEGVLANKMLLIR